MIQEYLIPPGGYWSSIIKIGKTLKIIDIEGGQGVDFLCYNADNTKERYHAPNTLKAALTWKLKEGDILYSDQANPIFRIINDTFSGHDTIGGCCSEVSNKMLYGVDNAPGCRENFLSALDEFQMDERDVVPNVNFFCNVPVSENGSLAPTVFVTGDARAGDYVELRAEMNALAIISNCPQVNNPCNQGNPTAIKIVTDQK